MSQTTIQPYLFFSGRCEEAVEYYRSALGAEVDLLLRYRDSPEPMPPESIPPGWEDKIMHVGFRIGCAVVMASDGCGEEEAISGFAIALNVATEAETDRYFNALTEGGEVLMPLGKTFWSPRFGMVTDRFGVCWMVGVEPEA